MSKTSFISQHDVDAIAISFMTQGIYPSINLVQSELKRVKGASGGTAVVTKLLQKWKEGVAATLAPKVRPGVPEDMAEISDKLVQLALVNSQKTFDKERELVLQESNQYKEECHAQVMKAEESAAIANSSLEKANSVIDHINSENMQLLAKFQELQSKNQSISQDLASSTAALGLETQKNHDLREQSIRERAAHDATVARIQSEAASELSSASIKASQKLLDVHDSHASQISVLNDKHHSSLTKEADLRERDAKRFMQDIDALRTQLASANKKLASDSEAHSSKLSTVNRQLENAHIENHTLTQRVAFLEGSIEATQQINAHLQTTIDSLLATQMKPDASDK